MSRCQQGYEGFTNALSPAETERLAWLLEELGEAQQMVGKILRHGYESSHADYKNIPNRVNLEKELAHVEAAINLMVEAKDLLSVNLTSFMVKKLATVQEYLHHQTGVKS